MLVSDPADVCIYCLTLPLPLSPYAFTFSLSPEESMRIAGPYRTSCSGIYPRATHSCSVEYNRTRATVADEWLVHPYVDPVFEKVGRVFLDAGDLVIRSDRGSRGFALPEEDLDLALTGSTGTVRLLDLTATVGTAHLSTSGLALNLIIDRQLHTIPMRSLMRVITGQNRKAPLFVPAAQ